VIPTEHVHRKSRRHFCGELYGQLQLIAGACAARYGTLPQKWLHLWHSEL